MLDPSALVMIEKGGLRIPVGDVVPGQVLWNPWSARAFNLSETGWFQVEVRPNCNGLKSGAIFKYIYPSLIAADSLGAGRPSADMWVMPEQRLMVARAEAGSKYPVVKQCYAYEVATDEGTYEGDLCHGFVGLFSDTVEVIDVSGILCVIGPQEDIKNLGLEYLTVKKDLEFFQSRRAN